ncbi:hypothetical protein C4K30_3853 [Pseudomonas chlororaphis subsp. piscium]|nr:hypothetical protein C4K30_3853 [Pseudomonas chlororaphis subsp. piscium]
MIPPRRREEASSVGAKLARDSGGSDTTPSRASFAPTGMMNRHKLITQRSR